MKRTQTQALAEYSAKLADPRWIEFRDWVQSRKGDDCEHCGCRAERPHVHHRGYQPNREPWEYELHEVALLCRDCHDTLHAVIDEIVALIPLLDREIADAVVIATICHAHEHGFGCGGGDAAYGGHVLARFLNRLVVPYPIESDIMAPVRRHRHKLAPATSVRDFKNALLQFDGSGLDMIHHRLSRLEQHGRPENVETAATVREQCASVVAISA